jgi:hypothetical protein
MGFLKDFSRGRNNSFGRFCNENNSKNSYFRTSLQLIAPKQNARFCGHFAYL